MRIEIDLLSPSREEEYEDFVRSHTRSLFYYSLKYRDFLLSILPNTGAQYYVAVEEDSIVGVFPTCIHDSGANGKVANALPFYGAHGGPLTAEHKGAEDGETIRRLLAESFEKHARSQGILSATVVSNPLDVQNWAIPATAGIVLTDKRVAQMTPLPPATADVESALMSHFHQKTRNMIRKGLKSGFSIEERTDMANLTALYEIHQENMASLNGLAKPFHAFQALANIYNLHGELEIYTAMRDGVIAAALLLLRFKDTIEYYTPVVRENYRADQPLSALIYTAMTRMSNAGATRWNWGGTWPSQEGVYRFKSRWGANDYPYHYDILIYDDRVLARPPQIVREQFPFYYVAPYQLFQQAPD